MKSWDQHVRFVLLTRSEDTTMAFSHPSRELNIESIQCNDSPGRQQRICTVRKRDGAPGIYEKKGKQNSHLSPRPLANTQLTFVNVRERAAIGL